MYIMKIKLGEYFISIIPRFSNFVGMGGEMIKISINMELLKYPNFDSTVLISIYYLRIYNFSTFGSGLI